MRPLHFPCQVALAVLLTAAAIPGYRNLSFAIERRALENKRPAVRARGFDVIYNLSVHAELLYPSQTNAFEIDAQASAQPAHFLPLQRFLLWLPLTLVLCQCLLLPVARSVLCALPGCGLGQDSNSLSSNTQEECLATDVQPLILVASNTGRRPEACRRS